MTMKTVTSVTVMAEQLLCEFLQMLQKLVIVSLLNLFKIFFQALPNLAAIILLDHYWWCLCRLGHHSFTVISMIPTQHCQPSWLWHHFLWAQPALATRKLHHSGPEDLALDPNSLESFNHFEPNIEPATETMK